jgi:hypothetical protein
VPPPPIPYSLEACSSPPLRVYCEGGAWVPMSWRGEHGTAARRVKACPYCLPFLSPPPDCGYHEIVLDFFFYYLILLSYG